jgi:hypothetical protein
MSVQVRWDNEQKTVIFYEFDGKWTWDEFYPAFEQARTMLAEVAHIVDFICVFERVGGYFMPLNLLFHIRKIYTNAPPNIGVTLLVGHFSELGVIYNMIKRVYPLIAERYVIASTLDEARMVLRERQITR